MLSCWTLCIRIHQSIRDFGLLTYRAGVQDAILLDLAPDASETTIPFFVCLTKSNLFRDSQPESRNPSPETQNLKSETRNSAPQTYTLNLAPENIWPYNPKP